LVRQIKPTFLEALSLALAVYPEARVDADKQGVVLHTRSPQGRGTTARHRLTGDSTDASHAVDSTDGPHAADRRAAANSRS